MITEKNNMLYVITPYNKEFVEEIKVIGGRWNREDRAWVLPESKREDTEKLVEKYYPREKHVEAELNGTVTLKKRVYEIVNNPNSLYSGDTLERLVAFAYASGREAAAKEVSDLYRSRISEMRKAAEKSRYKTMITEIIGEKNYIFVEDYTGNITKTMGALSTDL